MCSLLSWAPDIFNSLVALCWFWTFRYFFPSKAIYHQTYFFQEFEVITWHYEMVVRLPKYQWFCHSGILNPVLLFPFHSSAEIAHFISERFPNRTFTRGGGGIEALKQTCTAFIDWLIHIYSIVVTSFNPMIISGQASSVYYQNYYYRMKPHILRHLLLQVACAPGENCHYCKLCHY